MITDAFIQAYKIMNQRNWDYLYIAVDLHGTICTGLYTNNQNINFYPDAIETLSLLSSRKEVKLILFTSTHQKDIVRYLNIMRMKDINFDYVNENPECPSTDLADFSTKFYFSVLLDDKAGFNPEIDWTLIYDYYQLPKIECVICGNDANKQYDVERTSCHKFVCNLCCSSGFQLNPDGCIVCRLVTEKLVKNTV